MRSARLLAAMALVLLAGTAGCASSPTTPARSSPVATRDYPGSSAPPADPVPAPDVLYKRIPPACSALDAATLRAIAPGGGTGSENDASSNGVIGDRVAQHDCVWHAEGPDWTRTVTVQLELETRTDARVNAAGEYQNELPSLGSRQAIPGLGDKAQLSEQQLKTGSSAQLHVLSQNVVITIAYLGADSGGAAMTATEMRNATITAARAALTAIR